MSDIEFRNTQREWLRDGTARSDLAYLITALRNGGWIWTPCWNCDGAGSVTAEAGRILCEKCGGSGNAPAVEGIRLAAILGHPASRLYIEEAEEVEEAYKIDCWSLGHKITRFGMWISVRAAYVAACKAFSNVCPLHEIGGHTIGCGPASDVLFSVKQWIDCPCEACADVVPLPTRSTPAWRRFLARSVTSDDGFSEYVPRSIKASADISGHDAIREAISRDLIPFALGNR